MKITEQAVKVAVVAMNKNNLVAYDSLIAKQESNARSILTAAIPYLQPVDVAAVRTQALEEFAALIERVKSSFLSEEYASPQPIGSASERFACDEILRELRALSAEPAQLSPDFAKTIAYVIKEESLGGAACGWKSCSGCLETSEGQHCGDYPYSDLFKTHVGFGCSDCGGLGVVWEYYSKSCLDEMQRELKTAEPAQGEQWQPIEPKLDGTEYLTWNGRRYHVAKFDKVENEWVSSFTTVTKRLPISPPPRVFMPLPAAPTTEAEACE